MRMQISRTPRGGRPNGAHQAKHTNQMSIIEPLEPRRLMSTVVVNTTADSTDAAGSKIVSLRDAIALANKATSATTITFSPTVFATEKTITLDGSELDFTNPSEATTITAPAVGVTVSGDDASRVMAVESSVTVSISGMNITKGKIVGPVAFEGAQGAFGGGIANGGTLNLSNLAVNGNYASYVGGGIYNGINYPGLGTLAMTDVTVSANYSNGGGGVYNDGAATLINSTITGNSASSGGGVVSGDHSVSTTTMEDVTISANTAVNQGGGVADGFAAANVTVANSIIAGNIVTGSGATGPDFSGPLTSRGHNLVGKIDGGTGWTSTDLTGTVAKPLADDLGTLANNGGPTQTLLPLTGSPAIDHGSNTLIPSGVTTDQRGLPRIYTGTVDIGAVEVQPLIQIKAPGNQTATVGVSKSVTLGSFTQYTNDGPFKDTITWGDGTTTTLTLTAAGTIPATAHTFAKSGTLTVTETITDAKGNKSNVATFTDVVSAPLSSISGVVFGDTNGNGKRDKGEVGLGLFTVYLDINDDGKLDTGDKSTTTDINGNFTFTGLTAGTYYLRIVPDPSDTATTPALIKIVLTSGEISTGNLFGEN